MFENITSFFKKLSKKSGQVDGKKNKDEAKERLHLVLMQDRANVSADFLDMMRQEIINVIKKYIDVDEKEIDVTLTNKSNGDGTTGIPALYANIPIKSIKNETKPVVNKNNNNNSEKDNKKSDSDNTNIEEQKEEDKTLEGKKLTKQTNKEDKDTQKEDSKEADNQEKSSKKQDKSKEKKLSKKK